MRVSVEMDLAEAGLSNSKGHFSFSGNGRFGLSSHPDPTIGKASPKV